jgi:hypothetical protein
MRPARGPGRAPKPHNGINQYDSQPSDRPIADLHIQLHHNPGFDRIEWKCSTDCFNRFVIVLTQPPQDMLELLVEVSVLNSCFE